MRKAKTYNFEKEYLILNEMSVGTYIPKSLFPIMIPPSIPASLVLKQRRCPSGGKFSFKRSWITANTKEIAYIPINAIYAVINRTLYYPILR